MKVIYLSLTFGFFLFTTDLFGQYQHKPITKSKHHLSKYIYNGKLYRFSEIGHAFDGHVDLKKQYVASRKTFRRAAGFGWSSIASTTVGIILLNTEPKNDQWISDELLTGLWFTIIVAPTTGLTALLTLIKYKSKKNKIIKTYNHQINNKEKSLSQVSLQLGLSPNGFGLTLNF